MTLAVLMLVETLRLSGVPLAQPTLAALDTPHHPIDAFTDPFERGDGFRYRAQDLDDPFERGDGFRYRAQDLDDPFERAPAFRYHLDAFSSALARWNTPRYHLDTFSHSVACWDGFRFHLTDLVRALDVDRCICTTTRTSPASLRTEILQVSTCECWP
jgi:hypothetical protein